MTEKGRKLVKGLLLNRFSGRLCKIRLGINSTREVKEQGYVFINSCLPWLSAAPWVSLLPSTSDSQRKPTSRQSQELPVGSHVISTHRNNDSSEDMGRELAASATGFSPL
jgi:hypothetical protein